MAECRNQNLEEAPPYNFARELLTELIDFYKTTRQQFYALQYDFRDATKPIMDQRPSLAEFNFTRASLTVWLESADMVVTAYKAQTDALIERFREKREQVHPEQLAPLAALLPPGVFLVAGEPVMEPTEEGALQWLNRYKAKLAEAQQAGHNFKQKLDVWLAKMKKKHDRAMKTLDR